MAGKPAQGARLKRSQSLFARWARSQQLLRPRRRCPAVSTPVGGGARMTFQVIHSQDAGNARSPFRIVELPTGREVEWINRFLDREYVRRLAEATLRSEEHTTELQSLRHLVCRLLLEKKKQKDD